MISYLCVAKKRRCDLRVLMFGWEFPPFNAGGLGTACHGLTKAMTSQGVDVTFVLPKAAAGMDTNSTHVNLLVANDLFLKECTKGLTVTEVDSLLQEYVDIVAYDEKISNHLLKYKKLARSGGSNESVYGDNLFREVYRYSEKAGLISSIVEFDVIHAHDWMTYQAGKKAKMMSGKPLVVHIHATEFDRTAGHPNQYIYDLEREGLHAADRIIAVSNLTKDVVVQHYGINPEKVEVVHNGVEFSDCNNDKAVPKSGKTVLFLGRMTIQKGPEYFLDTAKKVLDHDPEVKFVMAGSGDMYPYLVEKAAHLGISKNVLFTGFLRGKAIDEAYQMADLYIMPSVSEPFGITPLESMRNNTPCIISKNSGVSEVLDHCLKVDFWDIDMTSNMILACLNYKSMYSHLQENGSLEVSTCGWSDAASKCIDVYKSVLQ